MHIIDVVFVAQSWNRQCGAYIIDQTQNNDDDGIMNAYYLPLPLGPKDSHGQFLEYSAKYELISIGNGGSGYPFGTIKLNEMGNMDNLKWNIIDWKWEKRRYWLSAAMISDDQLICCGGYPTYTKYVDIFDFKTNKMIKVAEMNDNRYYCGICVDEFNNNERIYIVGGFDANQKIEYFDINKNLWISLSDTNGIHSTWPIIWNDDPNIINVASVDSKSFEMIDIRQNKWLTYITNSSENDNDLTFNKVFGKTVNDTDDTRLLMARNIYSVSHISMKKLAQNYSPNEM